jgi:hypothetical protein
LRAEWQRWVTKGNYLGYWRETSTVCDVAGDSWSTSHLANWIVVVSIAPVAMRREWKATSSSPTPRVGNAHRLQSPAAVSKPGLGAVRKTLAGLGQRSTLQGAQARTQAMRLLSGQTEVIAQQYRTWLEALRF